ncbi:hypothetical protein D3C73_790110 [compost metagenome]
MVTSPTVVEPSATIRTVPVFLSTVIVRMIEFFRWMEFSPPPSTLVLPFTVIPFRVASPLPIPAANNKSPLITKFCKITPGTLITTLPLMVSVPVAGP